MVEPLKLGFIGGAGRGDSLWNAIMTNKETADLVYPQAICDTSEKVRKNWRFKVDQSFSNADDLLKADIDAVIIATPPSTHAPLTVKFLNVGIHVWSEVPMALSMEEIYEIIDAQKSNKGNSGRYALGENYCYYLQPQFMAKKNAQGKIGNIYYAEGEYSHSVEHYMIAENFYKNLEIDPEISEKVTPTWRANFKPLKYGHALGPALYVLNHNRDGRIERPREITAMGNMKMQKKFNTDNFQIGIVKTDYDTIIKYVIAFVLGSHGRIFNSFWGSRGLFMGGSYQSEGQHYYYEVPEDKAYYPERHNQEHQILTDEDLKNFTGGTRSGGHGGSDGLMFTSWVDSILNNKTLEIDVFRGAEMTAPGILAQEAIEIKKTIEIPKFQ